MEGGIEMMGNAQYIPVLLLGCTSSLLSIAGSSSIIFMASKTSRTRIQQRILMGLSVADLISSVGFLIMPFTAPSFLGLPGAVGNHTSCGISGFVSHFGGQAGAGYNSYLSLYYFLTVKRSWKEHHFNRWVELLAYSIAFLFPLAINAMAAADELYNPFKMNNSLCSLNAFPWYCEELEDVECLRGDDSLAEAYAQIMALWIFVFAASGLSFTGIVFCTTKKTFRRSSMYEMPGAASTTNTSLSQELAIQCGLYSLVFINTIMWAGIAVAVANPDVVPAETLLAKRNQGGLYALQVLFWMFQPLQGKCNKLCLLTITNSFTYLVVLLLLGFLNFLVYTRPIRRQWISAAPDRSSLWIYEQILMGRPLPSMRNSVRVLVPPSSNNTSGGSSATGKPSATSGSSNMTEQQTASGERNALEGIPKVQSEP